MTRTLRGAWTRRRVLAPLAVLAAALVASLTVCTALAGDSGDAALVGPLVLVGAVVLAAPARAVADERRGELALGRLRGRGRLRLVAQLVAEPLLALLLGGLVGLAVGTAVAPGDASTGVLCLLGVAAAGCLAVGAVLAGRLREPLADQVAPLARPRRSSAPVTFAGLVVLAAAGYAAFAAHQRPAGPPWLLDLAPALCGLALGQVLVWVMQALARLAVSRSEFASPAVFLAVRRLARRPGTLAPLALVVAAAVVATVAATAASAGHRWVDQTARLGAGAALQVHLHDVGAAQALTLTHRLDPRGRWLMAAVLLPRQGGTRSVLVDTPRYDRVAGPVLSGTAAAPTDRLVDRLTTGPRPARGDLARLTGRVSGPLMPTAVQLRVDYVTDGNYVATRTLSARPGPDGVLQARQAVPGCTHGCVPTAVSLDARGPRVGTLSVSVAEFAGVDLRTTFGPQLHRVSLVHPPTGLRPVSTQRPAPVIVTGRDRASRVQGPDGSTRPASVHGTVAALPLAGTHGTLGDLGTALVGALPTSPSTQVLVLARGDTPARLLAALPGDPVTLAQVHRRVDVRSGAARTRTALLVGLCALLVAAIGLLAGLDRQRRELAHEVAALRVVGYPTDRLRPSVVVELLACGVAALLAVGLGSWLAVALLLDRMRLLTVPADAVAPDDAAPAWLLASGGVVALLLVAALMGRGRAVPERSSRPALLREEGVR
ncbi:MAG TPA: FtsX-like permease family protein [Marmoricola sp.]